MKFLARIFICIAVIIQCLGQQDQANKKTPNKQEENSGGDELLPFPELLTAGDPGILEDVNVEKLSGINARQYDSLQPDRVEDSNNYTRQSEMDNNVILKRRKRSESKEHVAGGVSEPKFVYSGFDYNIFKDPKFRVLQEKYALEKLKGKGRNEEVDLNELVRKSKFQFKDELLQTAETDETKPAPEGHHQFSKSTFRSDFLKGSSRKKHAGSRVGRGKIQPYMKEETKEISSPKQSEEENHDPMTTQLNNDVGMEKLNVKNEEQIVENNPFVERKLSDVLTHKEYEESEQTSDMEKYGNVIYETTTSNPSNEGSNRILKNKEQIAEDMRFDEVEQSDSNIVEEAHEDIGKPRVKDEESEQARINGEIDVKKPRKRALIGMLSSLLLKISEIEDHIVTGAQEMTVIVNDIFNRINENTLAEDQKPLSYDDNEKDYEQVDNGESRMKEFSNHEKVESVAFKDTADYATNPELKTKYQIRGLESPRIVKDLNQDELHSNIGKGEVVLEEGPLDDVNRYKIGSGEIKEGANDQVGSSQSQFQDDKRKILPENPASSSEEEFYNISRSDYIGGNDIIKEKYKESKDEIQKDKVSDIHNDEEEARDTNKVRPDRYFQLQLLTTRGNREKQSKMAIKAKYDDQSKAPEPEYYNEAYKNEQVKKTTGYENNDYEHKEEFHSNMLMNKEDGSKRDKYNYRKDLDTKLPLKVKDDYSEKFERDKYEHKKNFNNEVLINSQKEDIEKFERDNYEYKKEYDDKVMMNAQDKDIEKFVRDKYEKDNNDKGEMKAQDEDVEDFGKDRYEYIPKKDIDFMKDENIERLETVGHSDEDNRIKINLQDEDIENKNEFEDIEYMNPMYGELDREDDNNEKNEQEVKSKLIQVSQVAYDEEITEDKKPYYNKRRPQDDEDGNPHSPTFKYSLPEKVANN